MKTAFSSSQLQEAIGAVELPSGELTELVDALQRRWPNAIRHPRQVGVEQLPLPTLPVPWYGLARHCVDSSQAARLSRYLAYACGDYYLQDAGSLLALAASQADTAELRGDLMICDLCAAPGGKASALVEAIGDGGFVLANEPIRSRVAPLQFNLARTGSDRWAISSLDPEQLAQRLGGTFDLVLVDAPCSGQALMSRGRQSAAAFSQKQISHSAARQRRILNAAIKLLRPGGQLIYSTCTFAEQENESQIGELETGGLVAANPVSRLSPYQSTRPGCYRLWPHRHNCAGSFVGSMTSLQEHTSAVGSRRSKPSKSPVDLRQWYEPLEATTRITVFDAVVVGWPQEAPHWVDEVALTGPELAHRTGQTWKPSHAAALRRLSRGRSLRTLEVEVELAKKFVRGETIPCSTPGWHVVRYLDRPLGWIKARGTTGKNHLPAPARQVGEILDG
ncbi:MAG: SAM-dependent methyltransferase [Pirellulales bacterium]|nr:SAM-dependent methyltransferase [Pirellulales bacterium]